MNYYMIKVWLILSAVLFFSCTQDLPEDVIAKVGEKEISVDEFRDILLYNTYPGLSGKKQRLKHRVLAALIAQKILAQEGRNHQLDFEHLDNLLFQYKNWIYDIDVLLLGEDGPIVLGSPESFLLDAECEALQLGDGIVTDGLGTCVGFRTPEVGDTTLGFGFRVNAVSQVPVPAAVWLFGTALLGFVGYQRKKKHA